MHAHPLRVSLLALALSTFATAQQPAGTITGHVFCADTNAPARFAKVMLKTAGPGEPGTDIFGSLSGLGKTPATKKAGVSTEDAAQQKEQLAAASRLLAGLSDLLYNATVAADGTYTFTNVKPGTYYIHATVPGYIDPYSSISPDDLASQDPAVRKRIASIVPVVTIEGNASARADLRLERGASITGHVLYDDGTPAVGWTLQPVYAAPAGPNPFASLGVNASDIDLVHISQIATTDDTGRFRIAGLPAGSYTLRARLVAAVLGTSAANPMGAGSFAGGIGSGGNPLGDRMGLRLSVYSGNALRLADAKPVSLAAGQDLTGIDITMPLRALHSISGHVTAQTDGHPVNSGSVQLTAQTPDGKDDSSLQLTASIHPDGSFRFDYVPGPATFTLKTTNVKDLQAAPTPLIPPSSGSGNGEAPPPTLLSLIGGAGKTKTLHTYTPVTITLQLAASDLDAVTITVPEKAPPTTPGNNLP